MRVENDVLAETIAGLRDFQPTGTAVDNITIACLAIALDLRDSRAETKATLDILKTSKKQTERAMALIEKINGEYAALAGRWEKMFNAQEAAKVST